MATYSFEQSSAEPSWKRFVRPPFYTPIINATCHWTAYGGTVMWPEVIEAMAEARRACVDMRQLLDGASEVISRYTHAEASHVVSGCAAGLQVGAAAIMTGDDKVKMEALPHTAGLMKNEFIARRFGRGRDAAGREYTHWGYAHAVRGAGGIFVEAGGKGGVTREELQQAFGPNTAGVYWVSDGVAAGVQLGDVIEMAHARSVPVLVDASNTLPPAEHLHGFIDLGADLVAFSGGKGLRGPQGSGILTGRADLIRAARLQSAPVQGIGRPMKVSKEEIVGLLTALEIWVQRDHDADLRDARRRIDLVVQALQDLPGVRAEHRFPDHIGRPYPTAFVHIDPATRRTGAQIVAAMREGDPSVAIMGHDDPQTVRVDVRIVSDEEAEVVVTKLREVLGAASDSPAVSRWPAADIPPPSL
ncbi:MAG: aminotransferase class V-fold PLP-dependent enzyme [Chloroflexi bacterium]|nr:aminotransferase class V-fold PLP-dependent enzyme [Chloroflexota bacterium]